jgi:polysaccharide biosynthesis/export protein
LLNRSSAIKRTAPTPDPKSFNTLCQLIALVCALICFAAPALARDYQIGEGDVISISVYDNPDLDKKDRVSNEGVIVLPLIGQVKANGLTATELSKEITARLADGYLVDPHVSVYVEEFRSQKVTILGEVNSPGLYEISGQTSFLELVSRAGGFTALAGEDAVVKRIGATGQPKDVIRIDLKNFMEKGDTSVDVALQNGDSIFVKKALLFYVNGEVRSPNAFKYQENMTVIKAITLASGFTEKASPTNVKIIRKVNGTEKVFKKVKMDMPIQAEDIIVVPESFF